MGKGFHVFVLIVIFAVSAIVFSACGGSSSDGKDDGTIGDKVGDLLNGSLKGTIQDDANAPDRDNKPRVLENEATGVKVFDGNGANVDCSNAADGYVLASYDGDNPKVKIQITKDGSDTYTYDVEANSGFHAFPLSDGSGNYNIAMFLNVKEDQYSQACAQAVQADITDKYSPFLRPNQYCAYTGSTKAVAKASEVAEGAKSDLKVIENAFLFVTSHVKYDYDLAANVQSGYIPDVDKTLATGMGICFDYASLTSCMLRTQGIPCRLTVGYAGPAYHAWISVHVEGIGWVANMIQFNGDEWTLMDPTFAASGDRADPNVVGDGENYNPVYYY